MLGAAGPLAADAFKNMDDGPKDASNRILYNADTGNLYYDAGGSGGAFAAIKFASIANLVIVTAADFTVI